MVNLDERLSKVKELVDMGKYFTINRARQYGKTTMLRALRRYLQDDYYVVLMDFQTFGDAKFKDEHTFSVSFASSFLRLLGRNHLAMSEKMEEAINESMMADKVDVDFNGDFVTLTLNGAFLFDSGKAEIKQDAVPVLNKIGVLLTKYADSEIEIEGHTDSVPLNGGRYENNDVLSSYRALAVFNFLKENASLDPGMVKHSGRGEYMPIADNTSPEGRAKNRRVEIKIYNALSAHK